MPNVSPSNSSSGIGSATFLLGLWWACTLRATAALLVVVLAIACYPRPAELAAAPRHPGAPLHAKLGPPVPDCTGKKIAILDIGQYASGHNFSTCSLNNVVVSSRDGSVFLATERPSLYQFAAEHNHGAHAAPWYLQQAIRRSRYFTEDLDEADIIFVDDYCYYICGDDSLSPHRGHATHHLKAQSTECRRVLCPRNLQPYPQILHNGEGGVRWLAMVHTLGRELTATPGDYLMAGYQALMESPRWAKRNGEDFVFYDSHPGFAAGTSARPYGDFKCTNLRNAVHLIMDVPMRYVCGQGWPYNKLFVTPYNPNRVDLRLPAVHLGLPVLSLEERSLLLFHHSACASLETNINNFNAGKIMRRQMAQALVNENDDVMVKCTNHDFAKEDGGAEPLAFPEMFQQMRHSVFCLALPGDAASTRRFSEIMIAGCIPVFIGPPYHSMPFIDEVDYRDAAVFFDVDDRSLWMKADMQKLRDINQRAQHETEARWWVPDADIGGRAITVGSIADIVPSLRAYPKEEIRKKLALLSSMQRAFSFLPRLSKPPNAANVLLSGICKRALLEPVTS